MKYFILTLLAIPAILLSQNSNELSQQKYLELQDKVRSYTNTNIDSAFIYAKQISKSSDFGHKAYASAVMSYLYQLKGDSIRSKQSYKQAYLYFGKVSPSREKNILQSNILNYGGVTDLYRKDLKNALEKFQSGSIIAKTTGDPIQVLKFNMNIALILTEAGNYKSAIQSLKESESITNRNKDLFSEDKLDYYNCNINYNLGRCFEKVFADNKSLTKFLDSAKLYYTKANLYSNDYPTIKVNSKLNLGNIASLKEDFETAQKAYYDVLRYSKENNLRTEYFLTSYNLGNLFFNLHQYDKSLVFFQKVDSIYKINKIDDWSYINANYYLAKIYASKNNPTAALKSSKIYLANYEKMQSKLNDQVVEVNFNLGKVNVKKEMEEIQHESSKKVWVNYTVIFFFVLLFLVLIILYAISLKKKKQSDKEIIELIEKFKSGGVDNQIVEVALPEEVVVEKETKGSSKLVLDVEKEDELIERLKGLEAKLYYLNSDFTLQWAARKIKSNTSYVSHVVNTRFGKTFSEYSNELKINYVINELITNPKYRQYTTQAIAESVGFKSAISFTKSFSKRTGVTPTQFTKRL